VETTKPPLNVTSVDSKLAELWEKNCSAKYTHCSKQKIMCFEKPPQKKKGR
jgi:hypothetical protein